jgi:hypothetical protein
MTYQQAMDALPRGLIWTCSFGYVSQGGASAHFRGRLPENENEKWVVRNTTPFGMDADDNAWIAERKVVL